MVEDRILDAAVEAAALHGIGRMSVADVAKRAGLSRPTVYKRFPSKDELVRATVEREVPNGPTLLFHDAGGDRSQTVEALDRILPRLKEQGYSFGFPVC